MKSFLLAIALLGNICFGAVIQQAQSPVKKEIKKDAKDVASGAKQAWHGVKEGGRTVGHKTKHVAKTIGHETKKTVKDVKKELKK